MNELDELQNSESMQLRESEDAFPTMQGVRYDRHTVSNQYSSPSSADNLVDPPGPPTERSEKTTERSEKSERDKRKIGNKDVDKVEDEKIKDQRSSFRSFLILERRRRRRVDRHRAQRPVRG